MAVCMLLGAAVMWVEAPASVGQQGTEQGLKEAQLCLRFHHWLHHEAPGQAGFSSLKFRFSY